jgi:hypothetical protein
MKRSSNPDRAVAQHNMLLMGIRSKSHQKNGVKLSPSLETAAEPVPDNSDILTGEFFADRSADCNSLRIPDWTKEIERRLTQFEPISILAKHPGTHVRPR